MTAYVYRVTHLPTQCHYIGSRGTYSPPFQDIGVRYFTSSKQVSVLLRESPEQFKIKIVRLFQDRKEALAFERKYQLRVNAVQNDRFFNRVIAGEKFDTTGKKQSIEQKIKRGIYLPKSLSHKQKISAAHKGTKKPWAANFSRRPEIRQKISDAVSSYLLKNPDSRLGKNNPAYGKSRLDLVARNQKSKGVKRHVNTLGQYKRFLPGSAPEGWTIVPTLSAIERRAKYRAKKLTASLKGGE